MTKVGEHITLDIIGTTKEYDPSVFEKVINDIAKAAKVTILNISKYKFEPQGFTIIALKMGEPKNLSFAEMKKILEKVKNYKSS